MTTIVFRAGILAADSRGYSGTKTPIGDKRKIFATPDGELAGVSSALPGVSEAFRSWLLAGASPDSWPAALTDKDFVALVVDPASQARLYNSSPLPSGPLQAPYFAIGSGEQYALGALLMGASAEEAVAAAIEMDVWSGGPITTLKLHSA